MERCPVGPGSPAYRVTAVLDRVVSSNTSPEIIMTERLFSRRGGIERTRLGALAMNTVRLFILGALALVAGLALQYAQAQQTGIQRTDLQRHDLSVSGREVVQVIVSLAPGAAAPPHSHPGEEIIYLLEGSLDYQVDGKPWVTLRVGDVLFIPAGTVHAARNVGNVNGAELATYVVEKGKPLLTPAN